jgi:hypothetical protein
MGSLWDNNGISKANVVKTKTVINYPFGNGFNSTYKHVDYWGMVHLWHCFNLITMNLSGMNIYLPAVT